MQKERCLLGCLEENKKVVVKNKCHSVLDTESSTLAVSQRQHPAWKILNQVQDDGTNYYNGTKAFTLIELLVVVLIIGILAAVALPQYQKTVWKSRAAQLYTDAKALQSAQQAYHMANGTYATTFDELAVEPSLNESCAGKLGNYSATDCRAGKYSMVFISSGTVFALFHQGPYYRGGFRAGRDTFYCYEYNEDDVSSKFCSLMGYNTRVFLYGKNYWYEK